MKRLSLLFLVSILVLLQNSISLPVQAKSSDSSIPTLYHPDRVAFTVHDNGTITAVYSFAYAEQTNEPFSRIIPVPSLPSEISVGEGISLGYLEVQTEAIFGDPSDYCVELSPIVGHGHVMSLADPEAEIIQTDVIDPSTTEEIIAILEERGHQVTSEMRDQIDHYAADDMYFVAIKANPSENYNEFDPPNAGVTQNIIITYEADAPTIPLSAFSRAQGREMFVFIFAVTQYVPKDYPHLIPDFSNISYRAWHQVSGMGNQFTVYQYLTFKDYYPSEINRIREAYNGQAFITQFADFLPNERRQTHHTVYLDRNNLQDYPFLYDPNEESPYLTRYFVTPSAERMQTDPTFEPDPNGLPLSNVVDLGDWIDPLEYWGCSSRTTYDNLNDISTLPQRFRVDEERFTVAYPDTWQVSQFTTRSGNQAVWAISPESVTESDIIAFLDGETTPPMFVFTAIYEYVDLYEADKENIFIDLFGLTSTAQGKGSVRQASQEDRIFDLQVRYHPQALDDFYAGGYNYSGMVFAMLATPDDVAQNRVLYNSIIHFAAGYEYYAHPEFRHTLFLNGPNGDDDADNEFITLIPYPEQWQEQTLDNGDILIAPQDTVADDSLIIRAVLVNNLLPLANQEDSINLEESAAWEPVVTWAAEQYDLDLNQQWMQDLAEIWTCRKNLPIIPFQKDGRRGFIRFTHRYIVEVSVSMDQFEANTETVEEIADGIVSQIGFCES